VYKLLQVQPIRNTFVIRRSQLNLHKTLNGRLDLEEIEAEPNFIEEEVVVPSNRLTINSMRKSSGRQPELDF